MEIKNIKKYFPFFRNNSYVAYLDSGATTQKPDSVVQEIVNYYSTINSNVHRSVHSFGIKSTEAMENARISVKNFINATHKEEIIFTKGTTESINLVANSFAETFVNQGDSLLVSIMEHHSNFVPWQQICLKKKANFKVLPINENADISLDVLDEMLDSSVKLLAITQISNVLGTVNPVKEIIKMAHSKNIHVLVDAAQSIAHKKIDVQDLDCDFLVFSGHKMYAPMGVGVLYGKKTLLEKLPPYQFGGEMIDTVQVAKTTFNDLPYKFEAGTPNVEGILGLSAAIDFLNNIGFSEIERHENDLISYATEQLSALDFVKIIGKSNEKQAVISFNIDGQHPYDVGSLLNMYNIAIRTGHHCAEPLIDFLGLSGTARISFAVYNDLQDIDKFIETLKKVKKMLA